MIGFRTWWSGWGRLLVAAFAVGLLAGAGQLGLAYGLGVARFARPFDGPARKEWPSQLTWVGWFAALAAVIGAVVAYRLAGRAGRTTDTGMRAGLAIAAGFGAMAVAPLAMLPARLAQVPGAEPVGAAGQVAALGAVAGTIAAMAALYWPSVTVNIAAMTGALWALAILSVLPSLGPEDPLPAVRLGAFDTVWLSGPAAQRLAVLLLPALALLSGSGSAALARRADAPVPVVVAAGLVGPALPAVTYLLVGPGGAYQAAPYWGSLIAVAAGALGSVPVAVLRSPSDPETAKARTVAEPDGTELQAAGDPSTAGSAGDRGLASSGETVATVGSAGEASEQPAASSSTDNEDHTTMPMGRPRRGPFRRDRSTDVDSAAAIESAPTDEPGQPEELGRGPRGQREPEVPAKEEEYVDWVSGLASDTDEASLDRGVRRSPRSPGHHHNED